MGYATFDYYRTVFMGTTINDDTEFYRVELEASAYIDQITRGQAKDNVSDAVRNATCAVAEIIVKQARDEDATISTESVGNHSRSYSKPVKTAEDRETEKYRKAALFLSLTGLLYRGLK